MLHFLNEHSPGDGAAAAGGAAGTGGAIAMGISLTTENLLRIAAGKSRTKKSRVVAGLRKYFGSKFSDIKPKTKKSGNEIKPQRRDMKPFHFCNL